jgi:acyl dehydratase
VPVSPAAVGSSTPPVTHVVELGALRLFAKATGQRDPLYLDPSVARAQGHPDVPVPPTYLFGLELAQPDPFAWITDLGVDMSAVLHGTQSFEYAAQAYAGDTLTAQSTITGVRSKKDGALELVDRRTEVTRDGALVAVLEQTIVIRNAA